MCDGNPKQVLCDSLEGGRSGRSYICAVMFMDDKNHHDIIKKLSPILNK